MYTLQGHTALVGLLRLSDKFLVSAAADGSIRGWDANDYSRKFSYHHTNLSAITTFYVSDNILVSGSENQFNIYNLRSGKLVHANILKDADQIWSVNFKGKTLVAAVEKDGQSFLEILDFSKASKINYVSNPVNSSSSSLESISTSLGLTRTTIIP
jgi:F-box and WD-40 domain protein CDC4